MRGCGRIVLLQDLGKDARTAEQSQGTGQPGVFAREGGLETLLGDVFIISVGGVLSLDVLLPEELGEAQDRGREAVERVSYKSQSKLRIHGSYQSRVYRVQKTFFRVSMVKAPKEKRFWLWCRPRR